MMARFNRGGNIRPVHSIKHVVDVQTGLVVLTANIINLIRSRDAPVITNETEVETGSTVNSVYLKVEAYATTEAGLANLYIAIMKNPGSALTLPQANQIGASDLKKYAIHQEMVMLQQQINGNPRTVFQGVIKIPRGYRRNGPDDALSLVMFTTGVNANLCFQCIYKEYR